MGNIGVRERAEVELLKARADAVRWTTRQAKIKVAENVAGYAAVWVLVYWALPTLWGFWNGLKGVGGSLIQSATLMAFPTEMVLGQAVQVIETIPPGELSHPTIPYEQLHPPKGSYTPLVTEPPPGVDTKELSTYQAIVAINGRMVTITPQQRIAIASVVATIWWTQRDTIGEVLEGIGEIIPL